MIASIAAPSLPLLSPTLKRTHLLRSLPSPPAHLHSTAPAPRWRITALAKEQPDAMEASAQAEADVEALEAKLGVGRRNRRERGKVDKPPEAEKRPKPKDWDSMTLAEKAWEVYVGETGVLFWLNKLAYASIFIMVGGWIVFRFIGPALGWYQLESPLLPPDQLLSGS